MTEEAGGSHVYGPCASPWGEVEGSAAPHYPPFKDRGEAGIEPLHQIRIRIRRRRSSPCRIMLHGRACALLASRREGNGGIFFLTSGGGEESELGTEEQQRQRKKTKSLGEGDCVLGFPSSHVLPFWAEIARVALLGPCQSWLAD